MTFSFINFNFKYFVTAPVKTLAASSDSIDKGRHYSFSYAGAYISHEKHLTPVCICPVFALIKLYIYKGILVVCIGCNAVSVCAVSL